MSDNYSKEAVKRRMRDRRRARHAQKKQTPDKIINLIMAVFTVAAVILVAAVYYYFGL